MDLDEVPKDRAGVMALLRSLRGGDKAERVAKKVCVVFCVWCERASIGLDRC